MSYLTKVFFVAICFLLLLSFNLNAASNKTEKESSSLGDSFYIPVGGDNINTYGLF